MNTSLHCVSLAAFCFHPLSDLAEPGAHRPLAPPSQTCCSRPARCTCPGRAAQAGKGFPLLRSWSPAWRRQPGGCWMSPPRRGKPCPKQHRSWRSRGTGRRGSRPCSKPSPPGPAAPPSFRSPAFFSFLHPCVSFSCCTKQREGKRLAGRFPQATENHGAQSWAELGDGRTCFGDNPRAMWCDHAGLGVGVSF